MRENTSTTKEKKTYITYNNTRYFSITRIEHTHRERERKEEKEK